jgi:ferritin
MLSDKMRKALDKQINAEFISAYEYLGLSAYFEATNLRGFAHWMRVQYLEERLHAMKIFDYVHERGGQVGLLPVPAPKFKVDSPLAAFEHALEAERRMSGNIYALVELAAKERDYATHHFLQWFVGEQVEEEKIANEIVQHLNLIGDNKSALYLMDRELAGRGAPEEASDAQGSA